MLTKKTLSLFIPEQKKKIIDTCLMEYGMEQLTNEKMPLTTLDPNASINC